MTAYERGFLDCRERAARECDAVSITYQTKEASGAAQACRSQILSLTPEAPDSQPEGVVVPQGLFDDLYDFLEGQQDVIDGADGPRPNRAMTLLGELGTVENNRVKEPTYAKLLSEKLRGIHAELLAAAKEE
jgi:hypothetical protein